MNENFFLGYPVEFQRLCLVYPPKVREVISNPFYSVYYKILTLSQEEIEDFYTKQGKDLSTMLTPFEYLLNNAFNSEKVEKVTKEAFEFFIHEPITFLYEDKSILIGDIEELESLESVRILKEEYYFSFQNLIRLSVGNKIIQPPDPTENPRIREMKARARYRDKIKAKKNGLKTESLLAAICCMNFGLNPLNIGELSYGAIPILVSFYQEKEKYELDVKSLLAGADSKKVKPKYWLRNLDD